mmetsp:Transcript_81119/g.208845  ORF Transcript_81119/g.208845 Transcript_81119/m.208845 type:complete len:249 (+) Transcript_81119:2871-3617(+)
MDREGAGLLRQEGHGLRLRGQQLPGQQGQEGRALAAAEEAEQQHQQEGHGHVREGRAGVQGPPHEARHHPERQVQDRARDQGPGHQEDRDAAQDVAEGEQGLRLHLRHAAAPHQRQAGAAGGHGRHRGPGDQGRLPRPLEGVAHGAERRPALAAGPVAGVGAADVQAGADVHPRRDRLRAGPQPHAEHRPHDQDPLPSLAVHRRVAEGGHVQPRERALPDTVHRRHVHGGALRHQGQGRQGRGPRQGE